MAQFAGQFGTEMKQHAGEFGTQIMRMAAKGDKGKQNVPGRQEADPAPEDSDEEELVDDEETLADTRATADTRVRQDDHMEDDDPPEKATQTKKDEDLGLEFPKSRINRNYLGAHGRRRQLPARKASSGFSQCLYMPK